jgi:hypothetical protein
MLGRLLCWLGFHRWRYGRDVAGVRFRTCYRPKCPAGEVYRRNIYPEGWYAESFGYSDSPVVWEMNDETWDSDGVGGAGKGKS